MLICSDSTTVRLQTVILLLCYDVVLLFLTHYNYVQYYVHLKSCAQLILHQVSTITTCTYITKPFIKDVLKKHSVRQLANQTIDTD